MRSWKELNGRNAKHNLRKCETLTLRPSHIRRGHAFSEDDSASGSPDVSNILNVARRVYIQES